MKLVFKREREIFLFLRCSDPSLCFSDENGVFYVNPTSRLGLIADCSVEAGSNCKADMAYKWSILEWDNTVLPEAEAESFFLGGSVVQEVALSADFFSSGTAAQARDEAFTIGKNNWP